MALHIKIKRFLVNLTLLAVSIIFALSLFEIYLRVFHSGRMLSDYSHFAYMDDTLGILRLIPNKETRIKYPEFEYALKINSKGLRDYEYPYEKTKNAFRIMILGDSFAFDQGDELKYVFAKQLEEKLKGEVPQKKFEVINIAVPGYDSGASYKALASEGHKYAPDLIIYSFFVNHFYETYQDTRQKTAEKSENMSLKKTIRVLKPKIYLIRNNFYTKATYIISF